MKGTAERATAVIGRDTEFEAITHFLDAAAAEVAALVIRGEPGIGKSTIWHGAVAEADAASFTILSSRPTSAETNLPYSGLGDLFSAVDDNIIESLPGPQRQALEVALLRVDAGSSPLEQRAIAAATLHVVVELAQSTAVLIAIDDLQWLDRPSVSVLRFALRRITGAPIGVLVASRASVSEDDRLGLHDTVPPERIYRMTVGALDLAALDRLLQSRLRTAFLGPTLRRLHETSGGNPLFALELARSLLDDDATEVPGLPLPVPSTLPELLAARLARISSPTRSALLAASALARPTVDRVLAATAADGVTRAALDQAVEADVITVRSDAIRFTHPLLSSVLYAEVPTEDRRALHRRLAALVTDPEEHARHLGLSADGPDPEIARTLERAARRAALRGAPDSAALLLEQAVDVTPPSASDDVLRLELDAVDQYIAAGDTARARTILEKAVDTAVDGPLRARALHRQARVCSLMGDFLAVPRLLQEALEEVCDDLPLRAAVERDLVWSLAQIGVVDHLVAHADAALVAAEGCGNAVLVAETLNHLCMAHCLSGEELDPAVRARALELDAEVGRPPPSNHPAIASGRLTLALTLKWTDDFENARTLLEKLRVEHIEHGDEAALTPVFFHLGELECWSGDWRAAARICEECHALARRSDQAVANLRARTLDAMILCHRGTPDAVPTSMEILALAESAGDWPAMIRILKSVGVHELALGDADAAAGHLVQGIAVEKSSGYDQRTVRIMPDAIEALIATGQMSEAAPLLAVLDERAMSGGAWAAATSARCHGLVSATAGDLPAAEASFALALHEHDRLPRPFERARTLLSLGTVQRRARKQGAARASLDEALQVFESLDADAWTARTRVELGRIAGRAATPLALTPTEEQVARLVADGRTNQEVASSMFISVKTVEANLTRIYRKLGVSSRRELAQRFVS